jgi:beta-phosphoglucomutase-like phosphatase (HAD superfamily)
LTALLALFDLDGTLFLTHDPLSGRALVATLEQVYGVQVPADAPANVEHRGLTAKRIGRNVLRAAGVADAAVDERLDTWCAAFAERYLELSPTRTRAAGRHARAPPRGWPGCRPKASVSGSSREP